MMTFIERRARAERLLIRTIVGKESAAKAWRVVNPYSKSKDSSAAEQTRREIRWFRKIQAREAEERRALRKQFSAPFNIPPIPDSEPAASSESAPPPPKMKRCLGVPGSQCDQEIVVFRNRKRCPSCAREVRLRQQRPHKRKYYRNNRERLCTKLRQRRIFDSIAEATKKEQERVAALPKLVTGPDGAFIVDPTTGKREPLRPDRRDPYQHWWPGN